MGKYTQLAQDIIDHVGGKDNINDLRHCITRLRFQLKDRQLADTEYLNNREGIVSVVESGPQYQVVIGNHVGSVYDEIEILLGGDISSSKTEGEKEEGTFIDRMIDLISGLFQPFLGALSATGMIKGFCAILSAMGYTADNSGVYAVLNAAGDAFFQYLPLVLAITASRKFKMNLYTSLAIAAAFLYPGLSMLTEGDLLYTLFAGTAFESPIYSTFLGLPIILPPSGSYLSSVIPIILAVWFGSVVEKRVKSIVPEVVTMFLTPFFTILITVPIALIVIGPLATWGASAIGWIFSWVYKISPILFGMLVGGLWQVLVIFGLHWGLVPIGILQLAEAGQSEIFAASGFGSFAMLGVLIALYIKTKEQKVKELSIPAIISAIFGITEPAIYSLVLPMRTPFIATVLAAAIGGAYGGFFHLVTYRMGGLGVFTVLNAIEDNGVLGPNFYHRIISYVLVTILGFVFMYFMKTPRLDEESVVE